MQIEQHQIFRGIILVYPHGSYIADGTKKFIIKSKHYIKCVNKPLLLIENKKALGIIVIEFMGSINLKQFNEKQNLHKISERERKEWWPGYRTLYSYAVVHKTIFTPISVEYPPGPQAFIKPENITFTQHILIGTSGYDYGWFSNPLEITNYCNSIELNSSFYRTPTKNQCLNLLNGTPKDFKFSIKVNRVITHYYKLDNAHVTQFVAALEDLKPKIKCLLFQFPAKFKYNTTNFHKLELLHPNKIPFAFEFRDDSWYCLSVYNLFKRRNWTITLSFYPSGFNFDLKNWIPLNFLYVRMHGTTTLYHGSHKKYIVGLTKFIRGLPNITNIFIYFNNTDSYKDDVPDALLDVKLMKKWLGFL